MGRRWGLPILLLILAAEAHANVDRGFSLSVLVNGNAVPEFAGRGALYVEALRGQPYALRVTNPLPYRVAVALSVDGLNTIDARHTDAWSARKWVLDPYETATIPGWQVTGNAAREFFFTGEKSSYGALLGKTGDLGVVEAVFFREHAPLPVPLSSPGEPAPSSESRDEARVPAAPSGASEGLGGIAPQPQAKSRADTLSDDYAATGMGRRDRHDVQEVFLNLERVPVASIRVRYEFRPQLMKLGILPRSLEPIDRREAASGFSSYCPDLAR